MVWERLNPVSPNLLSLWSGAMYSHFIQLAETAVDQMKQEVRSDIHLNTNHFASWVLQSFENEEKTDELLKEYLRDPVSYCIKHNIGHDPDKIRRDTKKAYDNWQPREQRYLETYIPK